MAVAEAKPQQATTFYARIPPQDFTAMPPRKAGNVRILDKTFTAGGKWLGPFRLSDANILREHKKPGCAPTFQVLPSHKIRTLKGAPGKVMSRAEVAAQVKSLQDQLSKLQRSVDLQDAEATAEAEEAVVAEAKAEMGESGDEGDFGADAESPPESGEEPQAATLDLGDGDPEEVPAQSPQQEAPELDLTDAESPTAQEEVAGQKRSFRTPSQHKSRKARRK